MGSFSVGGLASGLDTTSLIQQLMQVESAPKGRYEWRQALWNARKSVWTDLNGKLGALKGAADKLSSLTTWAGSGATSVTSSNAAKIGASITGAAPEGGEYEIQVSQLSGTSRWESSATPGVVAQNQNLFFQVGGFTGQVAVTAGDNATTVANKINADADGSAVVTASVVGGRLVIESKSGGAAGDMTMWSSRTNANNYLTTAGISEAQNGQDAQFTINGASFSRQTNTITDVIQDVQIDLLAVSANPVTVSVDDGSIGKDGIKAAILDFVDQYNKVIDFINAKSSEDKVPGAGTKEDYVKGPVSRDFGFTSVGYDLRRWATDVVGGVGGAFDNLADIGISTGAASGSYDPTKVSGRLVVDETKLDAALNNDMASVQELFSKTGATSSAEGIGERLGNIIGQMRAGGRVDAAIDGATAQIQQLQDTLDRFDFRLARKREYYERMFATLENTLGRMQQQGAWLDGQLASLQGGNAA